MFQIRIMLFLVMLMTFCITAQGQGHPGAPGSSNWQEVGPPSSQGQNSAKAVPPAVVKKPCKNPCVSAFCAKFPLASCRRNKAKPCEAEFFFDDSSQMVVTSKCGTKCSETCPRNLAPVCGSNGKTYGNVCAFNSAKCLSYGKLTLRFEGECPEDPLYG